MATSRKKNGGGAGSGGRHQLEAFKIVEINRSELRNAPYNPRVIRDAAKKKLRKGMERLGVLAPIVWNRRTGNIVSGHQRVDILDQINGTTDYTLTVASVDLDEAKEKEANLLLNNYEAQGEWDLEKLEEMLKDESIQLDGTGFDGADLHRLFGDVASERSDVADDLVKRMEEVRETIAGMRKANPNSDQFYLVFVFRDDAERAAFTDLAALDDNRYQDGRWLVELLSKAQARTAQTTPAPAASEA